MKSYENCKIRILKTLFRLLYRFIKAVIKNKLFKVLISVFLISYLCYFINIKQFLGLLRNINYIYFSFFILLVICYWILSAISLYLLFFPIKKINLWKFFKYQLISVTIGIFTPAQIGETAIVFFLKKEKISTQKSLAIFFINKIINFIIILLVGLFFLYYLKINFHIYLGIVFILFSFSIFIIISPYTRELIREKIIKKYTPKYYDFFRIISDMIRKKYKNVFSNIILNAIKVIITGLAICVFFHAFNIEINYFLLLTSFNLSRVLSFIPISISGLGILEGGMAVFLKKVGYNYSLTISIMFFYRFISMLMVSLPMFIYLWSKNKK